MSEIKRHGLLSIRQRAYELFKQGYGYKKAARELELSRYTVRDWYRAFRCGNTGYVLNPRATKPYDKKLREKIMVEHICNATPFSELAACYQIPAFTIRKWISRYREGKIVLTTLKPADFGLTNQSVSIQENKDGNSKP